MAIPRLLSADLLDASIDVLRLQALEAGNLLGMSFAASDRLINFLDWHVKAEQALGFVLAQDDVARLLFSARYWALIGSPSPVGSLAKMVELEVAARSAALNRACAALEQARSRWRPAGQDASFVVPDTNVLLHHEKSLTHIPWRAVAGVSGDVRVVVLLQVIDELDRLKRHGQTRTRARTTLRELAASGTQAGLRRTIEDTELATTTIEVLADDPDHQRLADADSEIVDRASALNELAGGRVVIITGDVGMQVRASEADVLVRLVDTAN